jgi:hypothetical protein
MIVAQGWISQALHHSMPTFSRITVLAAVFVGEKLNSGEGLPHAS